MVNGTWFLGSAFVAVGAGYGAFLISRIIKGIRSRRWPVVEGRLVSAAGRLADVSVSRYDHARAPVVDFEYVYEVDGRSYTGRRVTMSDSVNKTQGSVDKLVAKYAGMKTVPVHYNPANPAESVLAPGLSIYNFTPLITAVLFIAAGIYVYSL